MAESRKQPREWRGLLELCGIPVVIREPEGGWRRPRFPWGKQERDKVRNKKWQKPYSRKKWHALGGRKKGWNKR